MSIPTLVRISLGPHNKVWEDSLPALTAALQTMLDRHLIGPAVSLVLEFATAEDSSASRRPAPVLLVLPEDNALPEERVAALMVALQTALDRFVGGPAVAMALTIQRKRRERCLETVRLAA